MQETGVQSLGWEDPLEKETATHSSLLTWRIPWTVEPGGLQSMGSQRVGHNLVTKEQCRCFTMLYLFLQYNKVKLVFLPSWTFLPSPSKGDWIKKKKKRNRKELGKRKPMWYEVIVTEAHASPHSLSIGWEMFP